MHTHIVHAHPEPLSYNGALTRAAETQMKQQGGTVTTSDLYGAGFDPVEAGRHYSNRAEPERFVPLAEQRHAWRSDTVPEDIRTEIANLERAALVILQFPLWWHGPPAILKGWMDRVFMNGVYQDHTVIVQLSTG
jgi:NAD(P)H dehydrogenase (quinone)